MKRWWYRKGGALAICATAVTGACDSEVPTSVGRELLPPGVIQSFEVMLDADRFLVFDTAFGLYSDVSDATFGVIANSYRGELDSRILIRFDLPGTVTVRNAAGSVVTDSTPEFVDAEIVLPVDTLAVGTEAIVEAFHTTESWDRMTATWTYRVDSAGVQLPWTEPGGSPGALISRADRDAEQDTVVIPVGAADLAQWADTSNAARGVLIGTNTPGSRLRTAAPVLRVRARSELQPDTVVEFTIGALRTMLVSPELADESPALRVGGTPAWRGVLRLREGLDTVTVPCPTSPTCRIALGRVALNYAALLLQPVETPGGRDPELPVGISVHLLLPTSQIPLQRSPITEAVAGTAALIPPSSFSAPGAPLVELPLTNLLGLAVSADGENQQQPSHLALVQAGTRTFGFASFAAMPQLRLVLSITREMQLP